MNHPVRGCYFFLFEVGIRHPQEREPSSRKLWPPAAHQHSLPRIPQLGPEKSLAIALAGAPGSIVWGSWARAFRGGASGHYVVKEAGGRYLFISVRLLSSWRLLWALSPLPPPRLGSPVSRT